MRGGGVVEHLEGCDNEDNSNEEDNGLEACEAEVAVATEAAPVKIVAVVGGESRRSYAFFGDAVVFDTTYNTNKYSMIFAPFVGVNYHGQTILFACGLLTDETTESFVWLFSKFLEAMPAQAPQILVTDQDVAIAKTISIVLPESPGEFEKRWATVMENVDLAGNEWLSTMYDLRGRRVPTYVKHVFSAGMSSSQMSESKHSFFKRKKSTTADTKVYEVDRVEHGKIFDRYRQLTYYPVTDLICCSCRTFEFEGYPCRHMISYWRKKQVLLVPDKYILQRWTKNAKVNYVGTSGLAFYTDDCSSTSLMSRHGLLAHKASLLVNDAALTDARSTFLIGEFEALHLRVKDIDDGGTVSLRQNRSVNRDDNNTILDPNTVRAKGCGKRLKSSKEKAIAKGNRTCRTCGHVGHDKRTCPQVTERLHTDTYQLAETNYVCTQDDVGEYGTFEIKHCHLVDCRSTL
ncbi:Protein FAR-RED ELONGATED HYPOCOTYL 3 [Abeliophyllum distichum]|uniref:Protein FAR-RED ELONGATED HYPOCOTYL 3 n=1 Tax=Abeliophyllum distichum TaxID=126358 RepID=A0ABD1SDY8_9LAMI